MADNFTWIKLHRSICSWEWYKDSNTARVFIHILLTATSSSGSYKGVAMKRGQLVTTYKSLADQLGLTERQVRTAMGHLKTTGEVSVKLYSKYQLVTVVNYDLYQGSASGNASARSQTNVSQTSSRSQHIKNNINTASGECKNERNKNYNSNGYDQDCKHISGIIEL